MDLERFMFEMNSPEKHEHLDMLVERAEAVIALNLATVALYEHDAS